MKAIKKNQLLIIGLAIMVVVAGYLNWEYRRKNPEVPIMSSSTVEPNATATPSPTLEIKPSGISNQPEEEQQPENDYFVTAKMNKDTSRSQSVDTLKGILENKNSTQEAKTEAQNQLVNIAKIIEKESAIENLIKAKGFSNAIAIITDENANVVVKTKGLLPSEVVQIKDIVNSETKISFEKIKIVEIK